MLNAIAQALSAYGVPATSGFDPVPASFIANGQGIDAFFDAYPETVSGANNLRLGSSNPILSVSFSGAPSTPSTPSTLGGSAVGASGGTASTGSTGSANGYNCAPGSYCYAYLGKQFTVTHGSSAYAKVTCRWAVHAVTRNAPETAHPDGRLHALYRPAAALHASSPRWVACSC